MNSDLPRNVSQTSKPVNQRKTLKMENNLIFVYGTLKKGHGNWSHILKDRAEFLGTAFLTEPMRMKQLGFPAVIDVKQDVDQTGTGIVKGEVFKVSDEGTWKRLDSLESNGYMYQREERTAQIGDAYGDIETVQAWVYLATPRFAEQIAKSPDILPNSEGELIWSPGA